MSCVRREPGRRRDEHPGARPSPRRRMGPRVETQREFIRGLLARPAPISAAADAPDPVALPLLSAASPGAGDRGIRARPYGLPDISPTCSVCRATGTARRPLVGVLTIGATVGAAGCLVPDNTITGSAAAP